MTRIRVIGDGRNHEFHGRDLAGGNVFQIWVESQPGEGLRLHRHAYEEIFVVVEAKTGNVVVVPAGIANAFVNAGSGMLRQIDIHATDHILTEWLDDEEIRR